MRQSSRFIFHLKSGSSCTFPVQSSSALHFSVLSMLMKILLSRSHPSPDVALGLVHVKHLSCFTGQGGIDLEEPFGHVLMYRTLADPKPLRRLPHRRAVLYNIICNLHGSLFNIIFQKNPPANIVFTMYAGVSEVMPTYLRLLQISVCIPVPKSLKKSTLFVNIKQHNIIKFIRR